MKSVLQSGPYRPERPVVVTPANCWSPSSGTGPRNGAAGATILDHAQIVVGCRTILRLYNAAEERLMELRCPVVLIGNVKAPGCCQLTTGPVCRTDD